MSRRSVAAPPVAVAPMLALGLALAACGSSDGGTLEASDWIEIRNQRVALEIVRTPEEQALGLGYRDELPWHRGMLFVYDEADFYSFWMKGMRFDIDIIWIREGRIRHIGHRVPHVDEGAPLPTYRPPELSDSVLEVPAGYAQAYGWRAGDRITLSPGPTRQSD